jgi:hypothetical protein
VFPRLENVTNLLGIVANVLLSTSTNTEMEDSVESLILSMPMATKFDQRKKIKNLVENKRNQKNNLAKNFL